MKMKKKDIIAKLEKAIDKCKKIQLDLAGSDIPDVIEMRKRAEAKQEAFEAILFAMRGNGIYLNIEAG